MTALDTTLLPKIKSLIEDYGKDAVFTVHGISVYDPDEGSVVDSGTVSHTVKVTPPENFTANLIDGDNIKRNDCRVSIAASGLSFTPINGMKVEFDSQVWRIVGIQVEYTGESIGLYALQLRK